MSKQGIDSFLLDCRTNDDIAYIEAEFGIKGFGIIVRLHQKLFSEKGYYIEWTEKSPLLFLSNWFGGNSGVTVNLINEVVAMAIEVGIFDDGMFKEYAILTSKDAQELYFDVVKRRTSIEIINEYLLVSAVNFKGNASKNSKNVCRNSKNVCRNSVSKVKESKVNNNSNRRKTADDTKPVYGEDSFEIKIVDGLIQSCLAGFPKSKVPETIEDKQKWAEEINKMKRLDKLSEDEIRQALIFAVTDNFWKSNIRSAKKFREKFETLYTQSRQKGASYGVQCPNGFNNFGNRDYDMTVLENQLIQR